MAVIFGGEKQENPIEKPAEVRDVNEPVAEKVEETQAEPVVSEDKPARRGRKRK